MLEISSTTEIYLELPIFAFDFVSGRLGFKQWKEMDQPSGTGKEQGKKRQ